MPRKPTYAFNDLTEEGVLKPGLPLMVAILLSARFMLYGPLSLLATRQGFSGSRSYDVSFLEVDSPFEMLVSLPASLVLIVMIFRGEQSTMIARRIWQFGKPLLIAGALGHVFLSARNVLQIHDAGMMLQVGLIIDLGLLGFFLLNRRVADAFRSFPGTPFVESETDDSKTLTFTQRLALFTVPVIFAWYILSTVVITPLLVETHRGWVESEYSQLGAKLSRKDDGNWFMETSIFAPTGQYEADSYHPNLRLAGTTSLPLGTLNFFSMGLVIFWLVGLTLRSPMGLMLGGSLGILAISALAVGLRLYLLPLGTLVSGGGSLAALVDGYVRFPELPSLFYVQSWSSVLEFVALMSVFTAPLLILLNFDRENTLHQNVADLSLSRYPLIFIGAFAAYCVVKPYVFTASFYELVNPVYASVIGGIVSLGDSALIVKGTALLSQQSVVLQITNEDLALNYLMVLILAVIVYPTSVTSKYHAVVVGFCLIQLFNIVRLISMYMFQKWLPESVSIVKQDIWPAVFVLSVIATFWMWTRYLERNEAQQT